MHELLPTPSHLVLVGALLASAFGCSRPCPAASASPAAPAVASAPRRGIARQCPMPTKGPTPGAPAKVFVEVAQVEGTLGAPPARPASAGPPSLSALLDDPRLEVPRVGHVMAALEAAATIAWDVAPPPAAPGRPRADVERWDLTLTPHAIGPGRARTPKEAWHVPEHRAVKTTLDIDDQQTVVLGFPPGAAPGRPSVVVVTPYLLRDDDDMRQLFACKLQAAGRPPVSDTPPQGGKAPGR